MAHANLSANPPCESNAWNTDTGATSHMTPHRHWFKTYFPYVIPIKLADGSFIYSAGKGSVVFQPTINGKPAHLLEFQDVLHVPDLSSNLMSVYYLTLKRGYVVSIEKDRVSFCRNGSLWFTATVNSSYTGFVDGHVVPPPITAANSVSTCPMDITLWHRRFGHHNYADIRKVIKDNLATGIVITSKAQPDPICEPCLAGSQSRPPVPKSASFHATEVLELIHSDVKGPFPVQTPEGYRFWVTFIDDKSRYWVVTPLKSKDGVYEAFKTFQAEVENQLGKKIKMFRNDKGGEYISNSLKAHLQKCGIHVQHTLRNEPHQNGIAERANRTLAEGVTAILNEARLPPMFWGRALNAFVYARNRLPTSALQSGTPYFHVFGTKPEVSNLRVFGCRAYVHVQKDQRRALASHTEKCIFVGYPTEYKGWEFYNPETKKFLYSNAVQFDERYCPGLSLQHIPNPPPHVPIPVSFFLGSDASTDAPPAPSSASVPNPAHHQVGVELVDPEDEPSQVGVVPRRVPPVAPVAPVHQDVPPPVQGLLPRPSPNPSPPSPRQEFKPPPSPHHQPDHWPRGWTPIPETPPVSPMPSPPMSPPSASQHHIPDWPSDLLSHRSPPPVIDDSSDDEVIPSSVKSDSDEEFGAYTFANIVQLVANAQVGTDVAVDNALEYAFALYAFKAGSHQSDPRTFAEAMQRHDKDKWFDCAYQEIQALLDNGTWELVKLPPDRKAIGCHWVFRIKHNADGSVERYKGRVVAKGFSQRPGFDYTETFAPTAKWDSIRLILAIAALEDLELESVDISSAFLNGDLDAEVYMKQPEGFEQHGPDWVCKLVKAIYGLKQAGRMWHIKLDKVFKEMGFSRIQSDHSIWIWRKGDTRIIIPVFVDDMTIAAKSTSSIQWVKTELAKRFKLHDLGPTSWLLGVHIQRDRANKTITLSQRQYILDMLERYNMSHCSPVHTPLNPGTRLSAAICPQTQAEKDEMAKVPYINAVGALMWLAVATRPDILYAVGVLCRFNSNPGQAHWTAVKHLMRYVKGTIDYVPTISPDPNSTELFTTYSDADHGGNPDNGCSTGGWVIKVGTGPIAWSSKLQKIVTLSTTEAEYVAAVSAGQQIIWLRNLLTEFGYQFQSPSPLFIDNQSAIAVAKNPEHHGRMKHLDLRFFWLREAVDEGVIQPIHVSTQNMPADILTKALSHEKVKACRDMLGMMKCGASSGGSVG